MVSDARRDGAISAHPRPMGKGAPSIATADATQRATLAALQREFDADYLRVRCPSCYDKAKQAGTSIFAEYLAHVRLHACDPNRDFSEHWYLVHNADVLSAVADGTLRCGFEHWICFGRAEGRLSVQSRSEAAAHVIAPAHLKQMSDLFDPKFVRQKYHKALHLPRTATDETIFSAYLASVLEVQCDPSTQFDERYYLERNPDVRASVKARTHHCGFHHWIASGREEGRVYRPRDANPSDIAGWKGNPDDLRAAFAALFDAPHYAANHTDIATNVGTDAFDHFMRLGLAQGDVPVPHDRFDEAFYISYYPDVGAAKRNGDIPSGYYHYVMAGRGEGRSPTYDAGRLLAAKLGDAAEPVGLSHVHVIGDRLRPMRMQIDNARPPTLNIFVPTLDPDLMFGGYIAFMHLLCRLSEAGYRLRFLILEDFYCNRAWLARNLEQRPRWLAAVLAAEFVNCTSKSEVVAFNDTDVCIAYSTWTMHDAWGVASRLAKRKVLFFVQEYEPVFHENGAFQFVSASAYRLPHFAIFNSELLASYFKNAGIGVFAGKNARDFLTFQHALGAVSPDAAMLRKRRRRRRFVCYARPEKHAGRNLFEICVLAIRAALRRGLFPGQWSFHGLGSLGRDYDVELDSGHVMQIMPRVAQDKYEALLRSFDAGLSLMWAPHPSVIPFELARSGVVTVTNEYGIRTRRKLAKFGHNLVVAEPTIDGIAEALGVAIERSGDVEARLQGAAFNWPVRWDQVFDRSFIANLARRFGIPEACRKLERDERQR
jgi:hypothetical protein